MKVRMCKSHDAQAICGIYNFYIENTVITFEETSVSIEDMRERIARCTASFPWLVCENMGDVVGYAYASHWKERTAYRHSAETTVYVNNDFLAKGVGKLLYSSLISELRALNYHVALGCIALPNEKSIALHESFGYQKVAHFSEVGYKFNRWLDVGYWQK